MFGNLIRVLFFYLVSKQVNGLLCYSCKDLKSNEDCFNVTKCPSSELCYGRADGFLSGDVKHTTGCTVELKILKTNNSSATTFCGTTCHDNLCNLGECAKETVQVAKGPRCLSCDYVISPDECTNVTECASDEMCYVQKFKAFSQTRYRLGCMGKQHCGQRISSTAIIGKRSAEQDCSICCASDHCNMDACLKSNSTLVGDVYKLNSMSPGVTCQNSDPSLCVAMNRLSHEACKEPSVVRTCPQSCDTCDHIGWSTWQPWGQCNTLKSCGSGTKTRVRSCLSRLSIIHQQHCLGSPTSSAPCFTHCPVNGGWCYSSHTCNCAGGGGIYCSVCKEKTTCDCPTPAYGGRYCS